jgi:alpha-tubulin suppressor-like RCC1 family protein
MARTIEQIKSDIQFKEDRLNEARELQRTTDNAYSATGLSSTGWGSDFGRNEIARHEKEIADLEIELKEAIEYQDPTNRARIDAATKSGKDKIEKFKNCIACGINHTVGLKTDGTVVTVGKNYGFMKEYTGPCNTRSWENVIAVVAGSQNTFGLKVDGTVYVSGDNRGWKAKYYGNCEIDDWCDIIAISAGEYHTVGLKKDGTVIAVGEDKDGQCDVFDWRNIIAISAGMFHTVGLKKDGTVVAVGSSSSGQCDVYGWRDIVAISAGMFHTVGLKKDGTVVAVGNNEKGKCNISNWNRIVAIATGSFHTVGLKSDGTVVTVGDNDNGRCNTSFWNDIVAISASSHTVGLKTDGTVVAVGRGECGENDVDEWKNIGYVDKERLIEISEKKLHERRKVERMEIEKSLNKFRELKHIETWKAQGLCLHCGEKIGLFKSCKSCKKRVSEPVNVSFCGYTWRVLDVQGDRALLLSEKVIEKRDYNEKYISVTWEACSIRKYLNGIFYNKLSAEKELIAEIKIANNKNQWSSTNGGNITTDKIFLLSIEETIKYFGDSGQLENKNPKSKYFINDKYNSIRIAKSINNYVCRWWLRSPGGGGSYAAFVDESGFIYVDGGGVSGGNINAGIRPALWLKL